MKHRYELASQASAHGDQCTQQIRQELQQLRPIGAMTELGAVLGMRPHRGVLRNVPGYSTPLIFAKARQPHASDLERWQQLQDESEACYREAAELAWGIVIDDNRTIGNRRALEHAQRLQARGLTTPEEDSFILRLRAFWAEHPQATTGIVSNGKIEPLA